MAICALEGGAVGLPPLQEHQQVSSSFYNQLHPKGTLPHQIIAARACVFEMTAHKMNDDLRGANIGA